MLDQDDLFHDCQADQDCARVPGLGEAINFSLVTPGFLAGGIRGRINIENRVLLCAVGLTPGVSILPEEGADFLFLRKVDRPAVGTIQIAPKTYFNRDGSVTVGGRIDVRRIGIGQLFPDETKLVVAYFEAGLLITLLPSRRKMRDRWNSLVAAAARGEITTGSLYTGIGTLDAAAHDGLERAGLKPRSLLANDVWPEALEAMVQDNPARPASAAAMPIEEFVGIERNAETPHILIMGIPCKGASRLNVQHRDLPEKHPLVGHQVLNVAMVLQSLRFGSAILLFENVLPWADSISCSMLRRVLEEQGYATLLISDEPNKEAYAGLDGSKFGDMERRRRMALLAVPPALTSRLDFSQMVQSTSRRTVADIRIPEEKVDSRAYEKGPGMTAKAERGFPNKIVDDSATTTPVLSSTCYKIRPEDPKFKHPTEPSRWRLSVPEEHARLKGQPETLIRALPFDTHAHTALGNGTTRRVWTEFFRVLGNAIKASGN